MGAIFISGGGQPFQGGPGGGGGGVKLGNPIFNKKLFSKKKIKYFF
jgi:hypothetical protein